MMDRIEHTKASTQRGGHPCNDAHGDGLLAGDGRHLHFTRLLRIKLVAAAVIRIRQRECTGIVTVIIIKRSGAAGAGAAGSGAGATRDRRCYRGEVNAPGCRVHKGGK